MLLDNKTRYLQIAFNDDISLVRSILPGIAENPRIFIEAGTPYLKREGMRGLQEIRRYWPGQIVADLKVVDGAIGEVDMARQHGATAITALGSAPLETLNLFVNRCQQLGMISMIDTLGLDDPLTVLRHLKKPPDVVVLHRGRDEESNRKKLIQYRHVSRVRSKYDVVISAAGGVGLKEARSAIFNGANIVVANLVSPGHDWTGIPTTTNVAEMAQKFLETIE
jgi:bifunctional enzyme Fae/Hps